MLKKIIVYFFRRVFGLDIGGFIRNLAVYCGVVGFKFIYGRLFRYGFIFLVNFFDVFGIFVKSVDDVSLLFSKWNLIFFFLVLMLL